LSVGDKTGISWTDATWNPVRGCSRVSEGCRNCYAERVAARFSGPGQPYEYEADRERKGSKWTGVVRLIPERLADPLRWKKPRRIFVNSMSDLFHEKLTNEEIAAVFGVMAAAPQHTFQVLTKRARRMREWFEWVVGLECDPWTECHAAALALDVDDTIHTRSGSDGKRNVWPLRNVWLGVSVENQEAADERIPELLRTPAAVRFLSCEPLIGPVDLRMGGASMPEYAPHRPLPSLNWVIAGCESGPGARECKVEWLRSLRDQCAAAGVPYFLKQAEESVDDDNLDGILDAPVECMPEGAPVIATSKRKGRGPGGNRIIELPHLDGSQHAAFPEVS
jgi:protein gp37